MENKRKEAIEKYSKSIKGQFDYTVESAHITGFMAGYDAATTSGPSGIGSLYDPRFGGISNNKNPHRGSNFNEYKFECLMEDAKKLVEALRLVNGKLNKAGVRCTHAENALEEFKANWEIK